MDNENSTAAVAAPRAPDGAKPASAASASGSAQADPFFIPPPVVSNVVARQRWPWNGLVDVDYEISGYTAGLKAEIVFEEQGGTNRWTATKFFADVEPTLNPGLNRATWDSKAEGATDLVATVVATMRLVREE